MYFSSARTDYFLKEDCPYFDLTVAGLSISNVCATMEYYTRSACTLCGIDAVSKLASDLNLHIVSACFDGDELTEGQTFMTVQGAAEKIMMLWKVGLNIFDRCSGIATSVAQMKAQISQVNPACSLLTTRKSMPGAKDLCIAAVIAGGAYPHRLGTSETVLLFREHIDLVGGVDRVLSLLSSLKQQMVEKRILVECSCEEALLFLEAGADGIQFDKCSSDELSTAVATIREQYPSALLLAAGGINHHNCQQYAASGVDGLVTSSCFNAAPIDMSVHMYPSVK